MTTSGSVLQWGVALVIGPAVVASAIAGIFAVYHNIQKSKLDRQLQWRITEFGIMKSAFDVRFKEEFSSYRTLCSTVRKLISTIEFSERNSLNLSKEDIAKIIQRDLDPAAECIYGNSFYWPNKISIIANNILSGATTHYAWHKFELKSEIFKPDISSKQMGIYCDELLSLIATRVEMDPDIYAKVFKDTAKALPS